jgi:hypothetical protein
MTVENCKPLCLRSKLKILASRRQTLEIERDIDLDCVAFGRFDLITRGIDILSFATQTRIALLSASFGSRQTLLS